MDHRTPHEERVGRPPGSLQPTHGEPSGRGVDRPGERGSDSGSETSLVRDARREAEQAGRETRRSLTLMAERRKAQTADIMEQVATAMHRTAQSLEGDDAPRVGRYTDEAANRIERASGYLRDHDVDSMLSSTESFARRRPELFFGALALAGLALGRFLGSSGSRREESGGSVRTVQGPETTRREHTSSGGRDERT